MNKPFKMSYDDTSSVGTIYIYGHIENYEYGEKETTAWSFAKELEEIKANADTIHIRINSYGGVVSEGFAIYNLIKSLKQKTIAFIDGFACSIASIIPMACDEIRMSESSLMMIHKPHIGACGNADDFRKQADELDKILEPSISAYLSRVNISREQLMSMLDSGDTWLTPQEALDMGFCTHVDTESAKQSIECSYMSKLIEENKRLKQMASVPKTTTQILNEFLS